MKVCIADCRPPEDAALEADGLLVMETDVSDRAAVEALARRVADELGPVSVLMNNAGIGGGGDALSTRRDGIGCWESICMASFTAFRRLFPPWSPATPRGW
jgi:NAD(P)-dependent dehydrogenase (short-subunit alcohol dehydrogenase family)